MASEYAQRITPEQLVKARLRSASDARKQVLTALEAIVEALALVMAKED